MTDQFSTGGRRNVLRALVTLLLKEAYEARMKLVVLVATLTVLSLSGLLMIFMLPTLLPPGTIEIPEFTPQEAFLSAVDDLLQLGALLVALVSMDAIAGERRANTLDLLLTRPVSRFSIVLSKMLVRSGIILVSVLFCAVPTWAYTLLLFGDLPFMAAIQSAFLIALALIMVAAITLVFSALARTEIMAGVAALLTSAFLGSLAILPKPWVTLSPFHYVDLRSVLEGTITAQSYWQNVLVLISFAVVFFFLSEMTFSLVSSARTELVYLSVLFVVSLVILSVLVFQRFADATEMLATVLSS
ncbi:MAG: ABC transporter permease subunit [Candidatus Thorarchaeota archaeon]